MAKKITQPKGGTASSNAGGNSGTTKPKTGNQNVNIRRGG